MKKKKSHTEATRESCYIADIHVITPRSKMAGYTATCQNYCLRNGQKQKALKVLPSTSVLYTKVESSHTR